MFHFWNHKWSNFLCSCNVPICLSFSPAAISCLWRTVSSKKVYKCTLDQENLLKDFLHWKSYLSNMYTFNYDNLLSSKDPRWVLGMKKFMVLGSFEVPALLFGENLVNGKCIFFDRIKYTYRSSENKSHNHMKRTKKSLKGYQR